ncbi:MAG TPA: helix-hairpin-helix domain-containing protein, partial [Methylomirabilota bacterium]|nr:helix-hairpin-helix domain-containing protein [Methylomirabilota bacterium]
YRKFKIQIKETPDDFAMMAEMLTRRFRHDGWAMPDLILIDGGKGQLSTAVKVLKHYQLQIPIIGLAKRLEEIFVPQNSTPYILPANSAALFLLQRVRDEAHRFAITFHRKLRTRKSLVSALDQITGIGPKKKKQLLQKFGSTMKIQQASITELGAIVGTTIAEKIKASLPAL